MFSLEQMSGILSTLPDPAVIMTRTGRYVAVFGGADSRYYYDITHFIGLNVKDVFTAEMAAIWLKQVEKTLDTGVMQIEEYSLTASEVKGLGTDGPSNTMFLESRMQPLNFLLDGEEAVLMVVTNISKRQQLAEELRIGSQTDALTGVWNRRYFQQMVTHERKRAVRCQSPVSLLIVDIDHFKQVNDQYAHTVGDAVLCEIAHLIDSCTRESDIVVRWGGDEFVILMPDTRLKSASYAAEKLRQAVDDFQFKENHKITVSIGYTQWDIEEETVEELISKADNALYQAKNTGRNKIQASNSTAISSLNRYTNLSK